MKHIELGMLKDVTSLAGILDAPNLLELLFHKTIQVSQSDGELINSHQSLRYFNWRADGVPRRVCEPVLYEINPDTATMMFHDQWFVVP